ncbi:uncharacterized protein RCC_00613 [Ramularia collo-cygni]|uniref:Developmental regulator protein n=1 Tax=Ramularia collo-cygni TaxID=112498 RepID=A0A2D3UM16_9PEZI|nr:uncharacterized protein RCC_00613 [Ramularia collo-cygni]CZT14641.1 uncharacterized protein RCC_00613 [Ramularia collo-cygni]
MPVYLLHGFRWPRPLIRIHIILQNLDDAAAEWLVAPNTTSTMLANFHQLFPDAMQHLPMLRFIEQYDPNDTSSSAASQPYAYVADIVEEVKLGIDVEDVRGKGVNNDQWSAMMELRDRLAPEGKVGWYVVVCGDEERWAPPSTSEQRVGAHDGIPGGSETDSAYYTNKPSAEANIKPTSPVDSEPRGFRKFFRRKSRASAEPPTASPVESAPPLPVFTPESRPPQHA